MKRRPYIIASIFLFCFVSMVAGERQRSTKRQDRVPAIDIVKAIQLTLESHKKNSPETKEVFIDEAVYVRAKDEPPLLRETRF